MPQDLKTQTPETDAPRMSVLDEIRSTIASLDALRAPSNGSDTPQPEIGTAANAVAAAAGNGKALPARTRDISRTDRPNVPPPPTPARVQEKRDSGPAHCDQGMPDAEPGHREGAADAAHVSTATPGPESIVLRQVDRTAKIMIVDDEPLNVMTFRQHLKSDGYSNFVTTEKPREALFMLRDEKPDVLLLDIHMPEISGLDIMRVMGLDPQLQHIPVLILTADTDPRIRRRALDLGASDFLSKPIDPNELIPRVRNAVILKSHFDMVANEAARLEQQVERRTRQLEATRQQLIVSLARAAEHRDNDTGNHVVRVGRYTSIIAEAMGYPKSKLSMLEQAAQLHDVGKIGIPDSILFKPGKLDRDQYDLMKRHCSLGRQIIEPISDRDWEVLQSHTRRGESLLHVRSSPLLMLAARIAQTHHEKWDGSGYPLGLKGEDIPLEGRMVAVADVFDALSSKRTYKGAFSREKCFAILEEGRGAHFDPRVLDAFFASSDRIIETQLLLMDDEDHIDITQHVE